jgi:hypothetical protein
MARPLKDHEGNEPAVRVSYRLTKPRLERLREIARGWDCSQAEAVERLIDGHDPQPAERKYLETAGVEPSFQESRPPVRVVPTKGGPKKFTGSQWKAGAK